MNNEQFRRLVSANAPKPSNNDDGTAVAATPRAVALGSRQNSSIPMTPRAVAGLNQSSEFARQLAERNRSKHDKKFRSFAPKGSKLAEGYTDRAQAREQEEEDERAERIKALEEALKKEEIDQDTFDQLRSRIAGGDLSSTHLVKGLDFKLLERVRRGEDVYGDGKSGTGASEDQKEGSDEDAVEDALERMGDTEVEAVAKEAKTKKGQLSTTSLQPGKKRTRDQVLAEMKAAREAAKAKEASALGTRFKKIGDKAPGTRLERDSKGREVLIIVDEDGNEKRKVRKIQPGDAAAAEAEAAAAKALLVPDKNATPLGMEVPEYYKQKAQEPEEDKDVDIFDDVGDDYDPLAGLGSGSDDDSDEDEGEISDKEVRASGAEKAKDAMPPPPAPAKSTAPRNYFQDSKTALASSETLKGPSMSDPAIQAAFKRAAAIQQKNREMDDDDDEEAEAARAKAERRRKMLQNTDRDAEDMDMGFGTSRFEDEGDGDDGIKLSEWGADGDGGDGGKGGGAKRKRGPKKRKGDGNNAADVMRIVEKRRGGG